MKPSVPIFLNLKGFTMNRSMLILALFAAVSLTACDKQPTVVTVPASPVAVPGPAGPQGATGSQGTEGATGTQGAEGGKGEPGKSGDGTTGVVTPGASAPAN
jgi:hypothetical protein